jgi:hypothetical protein
MSKLLIVIPSHKRIDKLTNCVQSIIKAKKETNLLSIDNDIRVILSFDVEEEYIHFKAKYTYYTWIRCDLISSYKAPDFWNMYLLKEASTYDWFMYLNDDTTVEEDLFEQLFPTLECNFSDYDGVVGLNQANLKSPTNCKAAFGVIGKKFTERFPNKKVFNEEFQRLFLDTELYLFAKSINKFIYCEHLKINHWHPAFYPSMIDKTHESVRMYKNEDKRRFNIRQARGKIWGSSFDKLFIDLPNKK